MPTRGNGNRQEHLCLMPLGLQGTKGGFGKDYSLGMKSRQGTGESKEDPGAVCAVRTEVKSEGLA